MSAMRSEQTKEPCDKPLLPDAAEVLDLLNRQLGLYVKLREMGERQRSLISQDDPTALLGLLGERQRVVEELAKLDTEMAPLRRDWQTIAPTLPAEARDRASRAFQQARQLLEAIIAADQRDSTLLSTRKDSVGNTLRTIDAGRQACAAYGNAPTPDARYVDQMDDSK